MDSVIAHHRLCNARPMIFYEPRNMEVNGLTERSIDLRPSPAGMYAVIFENGSTREIRKILIIN